LSSEQPTPFFFRNLRPALVVSLEKRRLDRTEALRKIPRAGAVPLKPQSSLNWFPKFKYKNMSKKNLGKLLFVGAAFISFLFSVTLWFSGQREEGAFVGLWVPSILAFGCLMFLGKR
jgi:hypothetical protein